MTAVGRARIFTDAMSARSSALPAAARSAAVALNGGCTDASTEPFFGTTCPDSTNCSSAAPEISVNIPSRHAHRPGVEVADGGAGQISSLHLLDRVNERFEDDAVLALVRVALERCDAL